MKYGYKIKEGLLIIDFDKDRFSLKKDIDNIVYFDISLKEAMNNVDKIEKILNKKINIELIFDEIKSLELLKEMTE